MRGLVRFALIVVVSLVGCGKVTPGAPDAEVGDPTSCTSGDQCESGNCVDGVCCDTACDDACSACAADLTGAADGECAPVTAGTDPDDECADASCAAGTATPASTCDGAGACEPVTDVSCEEYACDDAGAACETTCAGNDDCAPGYDCHVPSGTCRAPLRVAIQSPPGVACRQDGNTTPLLIARLADAGHVGVAVEAAEIDTLAEMQAYDVILIAGAGAGCNSAAELLLVDANLDEYVTGGGGFVSTGWMLFESELTDAATIRDVLPSVWDPGGAYTSGPQTVTPVAAHPIGEGVAAFAFQDFANNGGGTKAGATTILTLGSTAMGAAWTYGGGRAVYLAPIYLDNGASYENENLLDGTQPAAVAMIIRSIEWAAGQL